MKSNKDNMNELELQLQEVQVSQKPMPSETVTSLQLIMTNSAFGYEYAMDALAQEDEYGVDAARIQVQVDRFKQVYFGAREKMNELDPSKLAEIEKDLQMQKLVVFAKQGYLH